MNILVTLNSSYINPLKVMFKSLFISNSEVDFTIYLMHSSLSKEEVAMLENFVQTEGNTLVEIPIHDHYFADAPILKHYSKEMYYRLLAHKFLPNDVEKILYLDPDILVINKLNSLYNMDISEYLYAAAYHDRAKVNELNKIRFKEYEVENYYNSGVLLMNVTKQRKEMKEQEIFDFVNENKKKLILPDQDIINGLYSKEIKNIDEVKYNFDARFYLYYKITNKIDMDYIIENTAIIHFCGKKKPWLKNYTGKFHSLYKYFEREALRH